MHLKNATSERQEARAHFKSMLRSSTTLESKAETYQAETKSLEHSRGRSLLSTLNPRNQDPSFPDMKTKGPRPVLVISTDLRREAESLERRETAELQQFCNKTVWEWSSHPYQYVYLRITQRDSLMFAHFLPWEFLETSPTANPPSFTREKLARYGTFWGAETCVCRNVPEWHSQSKEVPSVSLRQEMRNAWINISWIGPATVREAEVILFWGAGLYYTSLWILCPNGGTAGKEESQLD